MGTKRYLLSLYDNGDALETWFVARNDITYDTTKCEANLHISTLMASRYLVLTVTLESLSVFREQKCITNLIVIHLKVT